MKNLKQIIGGVAMSIILSIAPVFTGTVIAGTDNEGAWGDNGDGTYNNPVLPGDYSDPDIIRVEDDYYMITSTFQLSPGLTVLHSTDLVNWEIINHAVDDISQIDPRFNYDKMDGYGRGIWAPCITYNKANETFYIHFGTPDEGFFMVKTQDIYGEWSDVYELERPDGSVFGSGWDDCGVLWDDDGQGYFIGTNFDGKYSRDGYVAQKYQSWLYKISDDGYTLEDMGIPVHYSNDAYNPNERSPEAYKLFKKDGIYYIYHNGVYGSDRRAWLMRSDCIYGKLDNGENGSFENPGKYEHCPFYVVAGYRGPCQGNFVDADTENGKQWYFWTHQGSTQVDGRPDSLIPVEWVDGWPKADADATGESGGDMPWENIAKPFPDSEIKRPQTSDEFESTELGVQWLWNFQPDNTKWNLTERPGYMRMYAKKPLSSDKLSKTPNTLLQRMYKTDGNIVTTKIDISGMVDGQNAGLTHSASDTSTCIGIVQENGKRYLRYFTSSGADMRGIEIPSDVTEIYFRSEWDTDCVNYFSYSLDGSAFKYFGQKYQLIGIKYRGDYVGIYNYNNSGENGYIDVDYFRYEMDTPQADPMFMGVADNTAYDEPVKIRWSKGTCTLNGEPVEYDEQLYTPGEYEAVANYNGKETVIHFTINEGVTKPEMQFPFRINAGGGEYEGASGLWNGDISYSEGSYGYVGGRVLTYSNSYEEMYKSERFEKSFEYKIDLERNGKYKVKLYMMENYQSEANKRLMNIYVEGAQVEESMNIFSESGGKQKPLVREYVTNVDDNQLNIKFEAVIDNACVCGIEIEPIYEDFELSGVALERNGGSIEVTGNIIKPDGNELESCALVAASYDPDGNLAGISIKEIDITEQKTAFETDLESEYDNVSLFVWEDTETLKSIVGKTELSL